MSSILFGFVVAIVSFSLVPLIWFGYVIAIYLGLDSDPATIIGGFG